MKVSDEFTVPRCRGHHRQLHQTGHEVAWWEARKIDALEIAKELWELVLPAAGMGGSAGRDGGAGRGLGEVILPPR
jgi:hypothetical protein